jgi:predicted phosphodiesterase
MNFVHCAVGRGGDYMTKKEQSETNAVRCNLGLGLPNLEELYIHWVIQGCPNREKIREIRDRLPVSLSLYEGLLPYFNSLKDKPLVKKEDEASKEERSIDYEKRTRSIVVTSDWHLPFQDREALKVFFNFLYEYQPDELILNGNINDMTSFSSHPRLRELANVFRDGKTERENWFEVAQLLRQILPSSKIVYIGSQCHEGWLDNWVQQSPILVDDYNYSLPGWLRLEDYSIEYVPEVYDVIGNKQLLITHGTVARNKGGNSAYATMEQEGTSIIQGHTHRLAQVYKTTSIGETVAIESGCFCDRTPWYHLKGRRLMMDWQQGFVLVNTKGNSFSTQCVPIIRDSHDKPYFWIGKELYK